MVKITGSNYFEVPINAYNVTFYLIFFQIDRFMLFYLRPEASPI